MTTAPETLRALAIYALVLPLALIMGYLLATPTDFSTLGMVGVVALLLSAPLLLKWHYPLLMLSWNTTAIIFFLPGAPNIWMVMAFGSLLIALLQRSLLRGMRFIHAPLVVMPLVFLAIVVFGTAYLTGGIGLRIFGSASVGGKAYFVTMGALAGFFAMLAFRIPVHRAGFYFGLFFLGSLGNALGSLLPYVTPSFYYIFLLFPVDSLNIQEAPGEESISRFFGLALAAMGGAYFLLGRYGFANLVKRGRLVQFLLLFLALVVTLMSGFRTFFILLGLTGALVFYLEGMFRTKYGVLLLGGFLVAACLVIPLANKLPMPMQRALSVLPVNVDLEAKIAGQLSTEWRVKMWKAVLPEVPRYLWLGKGFAVGGIQMELAMELGRRGMMSPEDISVLTGAYHNGPLTVLIPFGIWGAIAWVWFLIASLRALYLNYRAGDPALQTINRFLFAYFLARSLLFFTVFGEFRYDFPIFVGIIGFSLALNGGVCKIVKPAKVVKPVTLPLRARPQPAAHISE